MDSTSLRVFALTVMPLIIMMLSLLFVDLDARPTKSLISTPLNAHAKVALTTSMEFVDIVNLTLFTARFPNLVNVSKDMF
jgi:hypothetical protein